MIILCIAIEKKHLYWELLRVSSLLISFNLEKKTVFAVLSIMSRLLRAAVSLDWWVEDFLIYLFR